MADLPELPRCAYSLHIHAAAHIQDFYTADQMREYAIAALRTALEAPAAREPLSLEQILDIVKAIDETPGMTHIDVIKSLTRAIEAAHGIGMENI